MSRSRLRVRFFLLLPLTGCCGGGGGCPAGTGQPMRLYDLYLGRAVAGRADVSDTEWREFRDQVVTPALPDGYTVFDAQGAWMNTKSRTTIVEATKVLSVALPNTPESLAAIARIRGAWQSRFHQYVAGMTVHDVCASFAPGDASK